MRRNRLFFISWVSRIFLNRNPSVALSGKSCFNAYSGFNEAKCLKQKYSSGMFFLNRTLEFFSNCFSSFTVHAISLFESFSKNNPGDNYFLVIIGYGLHSPDFVEYILNKPEFNSYPRTLKIKNKKNFF